MSDKLERQKITERDDFTYEEKERIAAKSSHKCAHCGREVYYGYGATVDHYIPLSKGGTNRDVNLIMLCEKCNREKGDLILLPSDFINHLNPKDLDALKGYFDSYTHSFEYIERRNLLACDMYTIRVAPPMPDRRFIKKNIPVNSQFSLHYLKRAGMGDIPRIQDYLIKYLKKYDMLDSIEAAKLNVEFWVRFGCIYYIEKNGEIKLIMSVTATEDNGVHGKVKAYLTARIFSYYSNDYALTLVLGIMEQIPVSIMEEQGLKLIPVKYGMAENDELTKFALAGTCGSADTTFRVAYCIYHNCKEDEDDNITEEDEEAVVEFFSKFSDVYGRAKEWLKKYSDDMLLWMLTELKTESVFERKGAKPL